MSNLKFDKMKNRRKREIEKSLKEIQSHSYFMVKALKRGNEQGEELALRSIRSELNLIEALYEDLQKLRGS